MDWRSIFLLFFTHSASSATNAPLPLAGWPVAASAGRARAGPVKDKVEIETSPAHAVIAGPKRATQHKGELGYTGIGYGLDQLGAVLDGTATLRRRAHQARDDFVHVIRVTLVGRDYVHQIVRAQRRLPRTTDLAQSLASPSGNTGTLGATNHQT